jgi:hypothetical protein
MRRNRLDMVPAPRLAAAPCSHAGCVSRLAPRPTDRNLATCVVSEKWSAAAGRRAETNDAQPDTAALDVAHRHAREACRLDPRYGARHLELQRARTCETDVRRGLAGCAPDDALEPRPGTDDGVALERFERGASFNPRAVRLEYGIERGVRFAPLNARHAGDETVAAARLRLDARRSVRQRQRLAEDVDRLIETPVVTATSRQARSINTSLESTCPGCEASRHKRSR